MRHAGKLLCWIGATVLGVLGCQHQPSLKPPEEPEVLATPDANDKRYSQPSQYPPETLANDPVKKALNQLNPPTPMRSPKPGGGMTPGAGGF